MTLKTEINIADAKQLSSSFKEEMFVDSGARDDGARGKLRFICNHYDKSDQLFIGMVGGQFVLINKKQALAIARYLLRYHNGRDDY